MTTILTFILVLSFLVFIHEAGHYLAARHVGVKVEEFSIGFPPKLWGKKIGETEYIISWIPLGGYVRLWGQNMKDEDPEDPANYASKSILQRFFILVAGPGVNLLFAFLFMPLVYMIGVNGPVYLSQVPQLYEVKPEGYAAQMGFEAGDEIFLFNDKDIATWKTLYEEISKLKKEQAFSVAVLRQGAQVELHGDIKSLEEHQGFGWLPHILPLVGEFSEISPVKEAGVQQGDLILSINGQPVKDWSNISTLVQQSQPPVPVQTSPDAPTLSQPEFPSVNSVPLVLEFERSGVIHVMEITPHFSEKEQSYFLGMRVASARESSGVFESVEKGTKQIYAITRSTFQFLGRAFQGKGSMDELGGPIRIGKVLGEAARSSIAELFFLIAAISLQLGIFNLFPIPVLDGGHIFFLLLEKIKGAPLSVESRERTQIIGFSLLMGLILLVSFNDVLQLL
ncbi:RIP metalloprotease RseP [Deltaproteobacteria bacterium TL4]